MSGAVRSVKKAVKGAAKTVKKVAKSDIGQIALAVAAPYAIGAAIPGFSTLGGTGFLGGALRGGITSGIIGLASGRGIDPRNLLISSALSGGLASLKEAQALRQANAMSDPAFAAAEGETIDLLDSPVTQSPVTQSAVQPTFREAMAQTNLQRGIATAPEAPVSDFAERTFASPPTAPTQTIPSYESMTKPIDTLAKVPAESGITQLPVDAEVEALKVQQGGADYLKQQGINIGQKPVGEFEGIKSIFQDQSLPLGDKIKLSAQNLIGVGGGDESLLQLRNNPSLGNLVNFAKSNPTAIIGSTSLMAALTAPKQPEETDFEYEERSALANELGNEYLESIGSDLSGSDFNSISDWESFFTARIGRAFGGSTEMPMGKPRKNAGGIMELDYRDEGGFVPIGIKEKADDVPAMLSKNEFVFTADAVKNAGNGDVDKGAERLYKQMKMLENGGSFA